MAQVEQNASGNAGGSVQGALFRRIATGLFVALLLVVAVLLVRGALTPDLVLQRYDWLRAEVDAHMPRALLIYAVVYAAGVSLSVPGSVMMTLLGGLLFGWIIGAGLDSVVQAQKTIHAACIASGQANCRFELSLQSILTPEILAAIGALGVLALLPVVVRRFRAVKQ